ncbi:MAG: Hpt domain-containing protein, partial [Candidatus Contendobacter sp.]|nr:Hpt domain-containing protein [Candidatus Contendobacter sp.]
MDEIIKEFLTESLEGLDQLDTKFVTLEQNPDDRDTLASIFRTVHTIKGTCGFLGFNRLEKLAHAGENLLSLLRDGKLSFNQEIATALLAMLDAVRTMLGEVERTEGDGEESYPALIETLHRLKEGDAAPPPALPAVEAAPLPVAIDQPVAAQPPPAPVIAPTAPQPPPAPVIAPTAPQPPPAPPAVSASVAASPEPAPVIPERLAAPPAPSANPPAIADSSIRVDVPLLDKLMNLVGELVLARNQILEYTILQENPPLQAASQRLNLITSELQEGIMRTRMQPINNIWAKFPRVVRDLALSCGK